MATVLVDLWGTLIHSDGFHVLDTIKKKLSLTISHEDFIKLCDNNGLFSTSLNTLTSWTAILSSFNCSSQHIQHANNIWLNTSRTSTLFPGAYRFLRQLKEQNHKVVLASAIDELSFHILNKKFDLQKHFDELKPTFRYGLDKNPMYYKRLCEDLKSSPHNTFMIGDSIEHDAQAADKAGLHTVLIHWLNQDRLEQLAIPQNTIICSNYDEILQNTKQV